MIDTNNYDLSIEKRRKLILEILESKGKVKVSNLSEIFNISEVTIRIDLTELENEGLLERVHGGAVRTNKFYYALSFQERITKYAAEKRAIALGVKNLIKPGDTIIINAGTTTYFIAQELRSLSSLTVVTNSISIMMELAHLPNFNVILLGGSYNSQFQFTYGEDAISQLKKYKADKLILSADGVSGEIGITTYHISSAEISKIMIERAYHTIVVADYSKIGYEKFAYISPIDQIDCVVTNTIANCDEVEIIKSKGVEVLQV